MTAPSGNPAGERALGSDVRCVTCPTWARHAQVGGPWQGQGRSSGPGGLEQLEEAAGQGTQLGTCGNQAALGTSQPHTVTSGTSLQSKISLFANG